MWKRMLSVYVFILCLQNWKNSPALWQQGKLCQRLRSWKQSVLATAHVWRQSNQPQITWHQKRGKRLGIHVISHITNVSFRAWFRLLLKYFELQVYKEREVYVKEWRKRKRLVMQRSLSIIQNVKSKIPNASVPLSLHSLSLGSFRHRTWLMPF